MHLALSVQHDHISVLLDGREVPAEDYLYPPELNAAGWSRHATNLAWPNAPQLSAPMGAFLLSGGSDGPLLGAIGRSRSHGQIGCVDWNCASAGGVKPFAGSLIFVTLWSRALNPAEIECLFFHQN